MSKELIKASQRLPVESLLAGDFWAKAMTGNAKQSGMSQACGTHRAHQDWDNRQEIMRVTAGIQHCQGT